MAAAFAAFTACSVPDKGLDAEPPAHEAPTPDEHGNVIDSLYSDGHLRTYIVHLPPGYSPEQQLPLVISLHGRSTLNSVQMSYTGFNTVADSNQVITVYPQGLKGNLSGSYDYHWNTHMGTGIDDVAFINRLIDQLYADFNINLAQVYATGFSNGAFFCYQLACQLSDRIAAIAPVGGNMPIAQQNNCQQAHPVPILYFHGSQDTYVPLGGIPNFTLSTQKTVSYFANAYACGSAPETTQLPDSNSADQSTITHYHYTSCGNNSSALEYYEVRGAATPGQMPWESAELGVTNRDVNANEMIWAFFSQFTHPNPKEAGGS